MFWLQVVADGNHPWLVNVIRITKGVEIANVYYHSVVHAKVFAANLDVAAVD